MKHFGHPLINTILIVDDIEDNRYSIRKTLQPGGYRFLEAHDGFSALEVISRDRPDIVLLDVRMPGIDGFEICRQIRSQYPFIPVVFITANQKDIVDQVKGFEEGGDDYILQPFDPQELRLKVKALLRNKRAVDGLLAEVQRLNQVKQDLQLSNEDLKKINDRLLEHNRHIESLSVTDPVTALYNRKYFHQRLEKELSAVKRYRHLSSALMVEIDEYDRIRRDYGELQTHVFLKEVAGLLVSTVRQSDVVTRYESGRFGLIFTHTPELNALSKAQMIADAITAYPFPIYDDLLPENHTLSVGQTCTLDCSVVVVGLNHEWIRSGADVLKSLEEALADIQKEGGRMTRLGKNIETIKPINE